MKSLSLNTKVMGFNEAVNDNSVLVLLNTRDQIQMGKFKRNCQTVSH